MIAELAQDLLDRVRSVAALATSSGLSIGGRGPDPGLLKVPTPAAWVIFKSDASDETDYKHGASSGYYDAVQLMMSTWVVMVFIQYTDDDDLVANQFPLLESVVNAVQGTQSPSGLNWRFAGQTRLPLNAPDRLAYAQTFTVDYTTNNITPS